MTRPDDTRRKRFYKDVAVAEGAGVFRITLDGRGVRTPGKRELAVPRCDLAEAIAAEWQAQGDHIDPLTMPLTRLINSALDGVVGREREVREALLAYGGSDLLCYLADGPPELLQRQSRRWGEVHAWAKRAHGIELETAVGVMPVTQKPEMIARIDASLGELDAIALTGLYSITTLTGSLLLATALLHAHVDADTAWSLAHIDEDFQIEKWGADFEASERRERRWLEMKAASLALLAT